MIYDTEKYIVTYDVEFEYDGQTYEPTEYLATFRETEPKSYNGADETNNMYTDIPSRWSRLIETTTADKDKYLYDSMVVDNPEDRSKLNKLFEGIQGKQPIDGYGNTLGTTDSGRDLHYTSVDSRSFFNSDYSRKVSTLKTRDEKGYIYNDLKISSSTSNTNLTFPFYRNNPRQDVDTWNDGWSISNWDEEICREAGWHLTNWDKKITEVEIIKDDRYPDGLGTKVIKNYYEAVYNYCLSINLGLVEREAADIAVEKDLTEALVIVNGKALKYKFNKAIDLEDPNNAELLYKQLQVADKQIEYKLGLYDGDYYYRAEVYNGTEAGNALKGFYSKMLGIPNGEDALKTSEMEIYLTYTINVYNQSDTFDVTIGGVADYYDDSFELIRTPETKYVQNINGKDVEKVEKVASPSKVTYFLHNGEEVGNVEWFDIKAYKGSDGVQYNRIETISLSGKKLSSGEKASITVTFKVAKDEVGNLGVLNTIKLGEKHNVAELTKFTSYYSKTSVNRWSKPGQVAGRIDEDSAPDNINIESFNEKSWYEDDTDSAPIIKIGLRSDEPRTISGIVWDDAQTQDVGYGQVVGNGKYNKSEGDKLVSGLTTEIYESISIPESTDNGEIVYKEYQFAWPTSTKFSSLGNKTMLDLTGFKQSIETDANGAYSFVGIPAGNYKVRFVYGNKAIETGKSDSEVVYSGQDYKSTSYQIGFEDGNDRDKDGYLDNEWHNLADATLQSERVSDARDSEARRLYISAKSEMLTYDNTKLLSSADYINADHEELFGNYSDVRNNPVTGDGYYMYAETAKINVGVENIGKDANPNDDKFKIGEVSGTDKLVYNIKNIDFGLEERSQSKITLDKQIKEIKLITSDNKVILDAVYDINYGVDSKNGITATVTLNEKASTGIDHIASLNRSGRSNQGYRYIIAEGTILQGTQIEVKYQLTAFNIGETDRISKRLEDLWESVNKSEIKIEDGEKIPEGDFDNALKKVSTPLYTESKGRVIKDENNQYIGVGYGTYFGSIYYSGVNGNQNDVIATTKIHQMIDYVDPDVEFTDMNNISRNQSWSNTDIDYLLNNNLIDPSIVQVLDGDGRVLRAYERGTELKTEERKAIISDKYQEYITASKNNLILTIDNGESQETGSNPGFVKFLYPYMSLKDDKKDYSKAAITLTVGRFYSSELDANDIDNLAEIIKVENTAGRRDSRNIAGNANPYKLDSTGNPLGIYAAVQGKEKDASATEVITLSPPTGLNADESRTTQLILVVLVSVTLVAVGIVVIKKKVLIKND